MPIPKVRKPGGRKTARLLTETGIHVSNLCDRILHDAAHQARSNELPFVGSPSHVKSNGNLYLGKSLLAVNPALEAGLCLLPAAFLNHNI